MKSSYIVDWCDSCQIQYPLDYEKYKSIILTGNSQCYHQYIKNKNKK